ncbi:MAG: hypothetical protein K2W82_11900 [Candidatus Obscuribacterales bacterium]|jgi:hypothetical protein|nr:hypothetical protein [Candidatus Obscuribacterales bacterium]
MLKLPAPAQRYFQRHKRLYVIFGTAFFLLFGLFFCGLATSYSKYYPNSNVWWDGLHGLVIGGLEGYIIGLFLAAIISGIIEIIRKCLKQTAQG